MRVSEGGVGGVCVCVWGVCVCVYVWGRGSAGLSLDFAVMYTNKYCRLRDEGWVCVLQRLVSLAGLLLGHALDLEGALLLRGRFLVSAGLLAGHFLLGLELLLGLR